MNIDIVSECDVGAEPTWRTTTKNNSTTPVWNETHDFVVTDFDQQIKVVLSDHDVNSDDEIGTALTTVKDILLAGGKQELGMIHKGAEINGKIALSCQYFQFTSEDSGSLSASAHGGDGLISGILNVLIASAFGIKGQRETLKPSVVVTWGSKHRYQTAVKTDAPGTDINNPTFDQQFRILVTTANMSTESLRIAVLDGESEVGAVDVPITDLHHKDSLEQDFDIGVGVRVRACILLRGIKSASLQDLAMR